MIRILFHLHGDLPTLTTPPYPLNPSREVPSPTSVKDAVEALGIPHTEIDLLLVDQQPVDFGYLVADGDRIEVHPVPEPEGKEPLWAEARLQPRPLFSKSFICDQHLGKLARFLRLLGFDTTYHLSGTEEEIERLANAEERSVLTCNRSLLKRKSVTHGRLIRSRHPDLQAEEVVRRFRLADHIVLFDRCCVCNGELTAVTKASVLSRIPPRTRQWRDEYYCCRRCDHLYWEGTHVAALRQRIASILAAAQESP